MIIDNATLSPIIINEYENVSMECHARGRPMPYITWFRRNKNQTSLENQILANDTNGQLQLTNVTRHQSGRYECRASNGVNGHVVSKEIQLRVLCKYEYLSIDISFSFTKSFIRKEDKYFLSDILK